MMNLCHLRYFMVLAEKQHFRKAAESLCITQPSLSHAISQLESELGVLLFDRQSRTSFLTKEGKAFLEYVQKSLSILDDGVISMQKASLGEGIIKLGFLRTLGTNFIPDVASKFLSSKKDKKINFEFYTANTFELIENLKNERYDIIFCSKIEQKVEELDFVPVSKQDLVLIVPINHELASRYTIDLNETLPYTHIYFSKASGLRPVVDGLFQKIGQKPIIGYEVEEDQVIAGLVSHGFGIAVVPYMDDLIRMNVRIIQISSPSWERKFYMATIKNKYLSPNVAEFKQFVIDKYKL